MSPSTVRQIVSANRTLFLVASPLIAVAAISHKYDEHDNRDLNDKEIQTAKNFLARIDDSSKSASHLANIDRYGVTLLRNVLSADEANNWDKILMNKIAKNDGTCIVPAGGAIGRTHCRLVKRHPRRPRLCADGLYEKLAKVSSKGSSDDGSSLKSIAQQYFAFHGVEDGHHNIAQLQLLDAIPASTNQVWHRDNIHPGLTALIALRDVGSNGPTELLLQTHSPRHKGKEVKEDDVCPRVVLASIQAGDAVVYDARTLHRGRGYGNTNIDKTLEHRPVLVIRWDANETPAPGTGIVGTQLAKWEGNARSFVGSVLGWFSK